MMLKPNLQVTQVTTRVSMVTDKAKVTGMVDMETTVMGMGMDTVMEVRVEQNAKRKVILIATSNTIRMM